MMAACVCGLLETLQRIYFCPFILLTIDNKIIQTVGFRGGVIFKNDADARVVNISRGVSRGLGIRKESTGAVIELFFYHDFLDPYLMTSDELQVLSARLNKLMDQARDLPDLSYEASSI